MSNYARGRRAEWRLRDHLRARGAYVVRSAGSKGVVDLVAFFPDHVSVYQVKTGSAHPTPRELDELESIPGREVRRYVAHVSRGGIRVHQVARAFEPGVDFPL